MANMIDIRETTDRVDELRAERDNFVIGAPDGTETPDPAKWAEENPDDAEELSQLEALLSDLAGNGGDHQWEGDWYPLILIHEDDFTEAMQELVEDIGDMPKGAPSYLVIDWEATADNLRVDYSSVEYDGDTYWYR